MATVRRWIIWLKMIFGKSDLHVNQPIGSFFETNVIKGYYNDFSQKVLKDKKHKEDPSFIHQFITDKGEKVFFPIQIAQYGLGCYELYLKTNENIYKTKMLTCVDFLARKFDENGGIPCMFFVDGLTNAFSAMCQGECISLFLRAYLETTKEEYLQLSHKAFAFLINQKNHLLDKNYDFYEYSGKPLVLNGFIFSLFGVFDYYLATNNEKAKSVFNQSVLSLEQKMPCFECDGWSFYDLGGSIASPFYHKLHIELLKALSAISNKLLFNEFAKRWSESLLNRKKRRAMFWKKVKQKI